MFDSEVEALQQGVHDPSRDAGGGVQKSFVDVRKVAGRSLSLIFDIQNVTSRLD